MRNIIAKGGLAAAWAAILITTAPAPAKALTLAQAPIFAMASRLPDSDEWIAWRRAAAEAHLDCGEPAKCTVPAPPANLLHTGHVRVDALRQADTEHLTHPWPRQWRAAVLKARAETDPHRQVDLMFHTIYGLAFDVHNARLPGTRPGPWLLHPAAAMASPVGILCRDYASLTEQFLADIGWDAADAPMIGVPGHVVVAIRVGDEVWVGDCPHKAYAAEVVPIGAAHVRNETYYWTTSAVSDSGGA